MIQHNGRHRKTVPDDAIAEVERVRVTAAELLRQLRDDRETCERRSIELSRVDPVKSITGRSAMDRAVVTLEQIIEHLDEIARAETRDPDREPVAGTSLVSANRSHRLPVAS